LQIGSARGTQEVALATSVPLTAGEPWRPLADGEIVVARGGRIVSQGANHHA
jgi:predicted glutamine amidotransferase